MVMTLSNPQAPATNKQLWLLHLLTKTDTRNLNLTMQQASDQIAGLKNGVKSKPVQTDKTRADYRISGIRPLVNPHASAIKQDTQKLAQIRYDKNLAKLDKRYHNLTGQGLNLGKLQMIQAFKEIAMHHDPQTKKARICVSVKASAIFPGGKKPHIISEFIKDTDTVSICPLFAHLRRNVTVSRIEYHSWIKSLPVKFNKYSNVPESWRDKALELAQAVDKYIAILDVNI